MDLEIAAKIAASFDSAADRMEKAARRQMEAARTMVQPVPSYSVADTVTTDANGNAVLFLRNNNGPDLGHLWHLRECVVSGPLPDSTVTGRADLFVSASPPPTVYPASSNFLETFGPGGWRDTTATIPNVAFYSRGQIVCRAGESLFVVITGGTAATIYTAVITVEDYQEGARSQIEAM